MVGGERDEVSAGEHQADGHRNKAVLHGRTPACARKRCQILETAKVSTHEGPQTAAVATTHRPSRHLPAD